MPVNKDFIRIRLNNGDECNVFKNSTTKCFENNNINNNINHKVNLPFSWLSLDKTYFKDPILNICFYIV